jgi:beta-carotene ketolase (CrtW type)
MTATSGRAGGTDAGRWMGAPLAIAVLVAFAASLAALLGSAAIWESPVAVAVGALWMTWLATGLFITAHDGMHGTIVPGNRRWNDRIGALALFVYAGFPWRRMIAMHRLHHTHAGTEGDPDHHDGAHPGPVRWYLRFVRTYVSWRQFVFFAVGYNVLEHVVGIDERAILAFWIVPVVASTVQLFVFGTWLPHRDETASPDRHRAHSSRLPRWASLLACFHFDYHWEHHEWPHLPWWRLPAARWRRE